MIRHAETEWTGHCIAFGNLSAQRRHTAFDIHILSKQNGLMPHYKCSSEAHEDSTVYLISSTFQAQCSSSMGAFLPFLQIKLIFPVPSIGCSRY